MTLDMPVDSVGSVVRERRREPRSGTDWIAMIRLADGAEIACTVKDVSKSGARLGIPAEVALPETFLVRVLGYDFLFGVRRVWRSGSNAGVRIDRVGKCPPPAPREDPPKASAAQPEAYRPLGTRRGRFSPL